MDAKLIKELRDRTGAGFLDVKKALEATNEDVDKAIEWLQERGQAKAAKKAGAIAAEGVVAIAQEGNKVVIYEVNSQTDFVASNDQFLATVETIGKALATNDFSNAEEANKVVYEGKTIEQITTDATATIGEKIVLRRVEAFNLQYNQVAGKYVHVNKRVAGLVIANGSNEDALRNVAMHVASMNPQFLDEKGVPADKLAEMKAEISSSETLASKPENIRENIAAGMLRKQLSELTLVDQEFVMEKMPVSKYLANNSLEAVSMVRFEIGEGIEKKEENFAEEVAKQMAA